MRNLGRQSRYKVLVAFIIHDMFLFMNAQEYCPLFVDHVRECILVFKQMPDELQTIDFCTGPRHKECPFFKYLQNRMSCCPSFVECALCRHFKASNFNGLSFIAEKWCLADFTSCVRYQIRQADEQPPPDLLPDGKIMDLESA